MSDFRSLLDPCGDEKLLRGEAPRALGDLKDRNKRELLNCHYISRKLSTNLDK